MKNKKLFLPAILMLMSTGMAHAQKAYVSVQQNGTAVTAVGTAAFDLSSTPTLEFVDGKAVMTVGSNTVAKLPMSDGGQLAVEFNGTEKNVSKTLTNGYATLYSPFQLQVPSTGDVEVYAPRFKAPMLKLNDDTKVAPGAIIPAGTGLLLKNNGTIDFTFSDGAATDTHVSDLSGSALKIAKPVERHMTVYTLGHESTTNEYGFFEYSGDYMNPGFAYLFAPTLSDGENAKYVAFDFGDETEGISLTPALSQGEGVRKYIENGRIVVLKNGKKYTASGQVLK